METRSFTTRQVRQILNVSRSAFQVWMQHYIAPSLQPPSGQGGAAMWSFADLVAVKVFQTLIQAGVSRERAADCARDQLKSGQMAGWRLFFFAEGGMEGAAMASEGGHLDSALMLAGDFNRYPVSIGVQLDSVIGQIERDIARL